MADVLADLSNALVAAVTSASTGVIRVDARRRLPATGILWTADGVIVTANHVVRRDESIQAGLPDGDNLPATLVGRDPTTDIAVLQVEAKGLTPFTEANKQALNVGNLILALGRTGKSVQATMGIVSALGDSWRTRMGGQVDRYLQTDVVMYPGFSGGPLIDAYGHLVGMNTSAVLPGISVTIPTSTLARVVESLLAHGRVKRGYLGVSSQQVRLPDAVREPGGPKTGLLIVSVEADSPAENGGLLLGDTIVGMAGEAIGQHDDLLNLLTGERVGSSVPVTILRGGQRQTLQVSIGERP